jgi:hypothetical protein
MKERERQLQSRKRRELDEHAPPRDIRTFFSMAIAASSYRYPSTIASSTGLSADWGAAKKYARRHCGYTISALRACVPIALSQTLDVHSDSYTRSGGMVHGASRGHL